MADFDYMMMGRLVTDCEYWLNFGKRCDKHLWAGNPKDQIKEMRRLHDKVEVKPEWLTAEQITKYETEMLAKPLDIN